MFCILKTSFRLKLQNKIKYFDLKIPSVNIFISLVANWQKSSELKIYFCNNRSFFFLSNEVHILSDKLPSYTTDTAVTVHHWYCCDRTPLILLWPSTTDIAVTVHHWYCCDRKPLIFQWPSTTDIVVTVYYWYCGDRPPLILWWPSTTGIAVIVHHWYCGDRPPLILWWPSTTDIVVAVHHWYYTDGANARSNWFFLRC